MRLICSGEQFTCFTSTKVQILSLHRMRLICSGTRTPRFTSFRQVSLLALLVQELQASLANSRELSFLALLAQKSTNTATGVEPRVLRAAGDQFTCFTGTKVQILTPEVLQFEQYQSAKEFMYHAKFSGTQFTSVACFTGTAVHILTRGVSGLFLDTFSAQNISLLALLVLLVQQYTY
jgi:hypothetical protein